MSYFILSYCLVTVNIFQFFYWSCMIRIGCLQHVKFKFRYAWIWMISINFFNSVLGTERHGRVSGIKHCSTLHQNLCFPPPLSQCFSTLQSMVNFHRKTSSPLLWGHWLSSCCVIVISRILEIILCLSLSFWQTSLIMILQDHPHSSKLHDFVLSGGRVEFFCSCIP